MNFSRTRIAPTPSGYLHPGNIFSFRRYRRAGRAYRRKNTAADRRPGPAARNAGLHPGYFRHAAFPPASLRQEGPANAEDFTQHYSQLSRLPLHAKARLNSCATAGRCSPVPVPCSRLASAQPCNCRNIPAGPAGRELEAAHGSCSIPLTVQTLSGIPVQTTLPLSMKEFVVRKKDGFPAYQLSSVADDDHYHTDLIVRGQDLRDSTLAQLYLARLLPGSSFPQNVFYHHTLDAYRRSRPQTVQISRR